MIFYSGECIMEKILINAYAKINLTLNVLRRLESGYHELEMIMQSVGLNDTVEVVKNNLGEVRVFSNSSKVPLDPSNTAYRAADGIIQKYELKSGVDIHIEKRIPVAAGLAGGSADAAAVIKAMREMFLPRIPIEKFQKFASAIGKDVPFCLKNGTAFAFGLGDKLVYLKDCPVFNVVIAKPDIDVSTASVYKALKLDEITMRPDTKSVLRAIDLSDRQGIANGVLNVLETVTAVKYPVICRIKEFMNKNGALASAMSGSGPSVFGLFDNKNDADIVCEAIKKEFGITEVYSTQTVNPRD